MQDYYNIPKFSFGGFVSKELQKQLPQLAGKSQKEVIEVFGKIMEKFGGSNIAKLFSKENLTQREAQRLAKSVNIMNELVKNPKSMDNLIKNLEANPTRRDRVLKNLTKIVEEKATANKAKAVAKKAADKAKEVASETKEKVASETKKATEKAKETLTNNFFTRHPYLSGGIALGLSNGTIREGLGNVVKYWTTPVNKWEQLSNPATTSNQEFLFMNGTKIPLKRNSDGFFVPVTEENTTSSNSEDADIDAAVSAANSSSTSDNSYVPNSGFNDLFEGDQWLQ